MDGNNKGIPLYTIILNYKKIVLVEISDRVLS